MATYIYSVSLDFPNGKVSSDRLEHEIDADEVITGSSSLEAITIDADDCSIRFASTLSAAAENALDAIVGSHSGMSVPDFSVAITATTTTPSPGGTGNCDVVDTGDGYSYLVPADGDGLHDVDLETAAPVPATGDGHWNVDPDTEVITGAPSGDGGFDLLTIDAKTSLGAFEWRSSRWTLTLRLKED